MKAKELRIGNLGYDVVNGRNVEVIAISSTWNDVWVRYGNRSDYKIGVKDLVPHELTEKWLLIFGFELHLRNDLICDYYIHPKTKECIAWYRKDYSFVFDFDDRGIDIKNVHQLQNLYYALTGEELTLKSNL